MGGGTHASLGAGRQQFRDGHDQRRIHQRFIALYIDDDGFTGQLQQVTGLSKSVTATGMVNIGEDRFNAVRITRRDDLRAVSRDHHANIAAHQGAGHLGALGDANDHRHTVNIGQWFVGQTCGGQTCGNQHCEGHRANPSADRKVNSALAFKARVPRPS